MRFITCINLLSIHVCGEYNLCAACCVNFFPTKLLSTRAEKWKWVQHLEACYCLENNSYIIEDFIEPWINILNMGSNGN